MKKKREKVGGGGVGEMCTKNGGIRVDVYGEVELL